MHCWYWRADACRDHALPFALGHAWAMKAVHGSKTKCDRHDAEAIARLLRGGNFPLAYAYPKERRGLRDLLRARLRLVRQRAELYGHVHTARRQANLPPVSNDVKYKSKRAAITADLADPFVRRRVETHLALLEPLATTIRRLEAEIEDAAQEHYPTELAVLQSTPERVGARCPRCREPLYERGEPPRRPGEGVAACATHRDNAAAGTCQRCGNFACTVCRTRWRDRMLCGACLERELESNAAAPDEARMQTLQAVLSLVFAVGGWVLVVLAFVLIVAGMEGGGGPNYILVGVGGLMIMTSPGPAVLAVGQAAAALRARGGHMILATLGLLLGGLHVGAIIGLFTFSLWQNY